MKKASAQLDFGLIVTDPQAHRIVSMRKQRKCLNCQEQFSSHGPGNRVCGPCKDLEGWKSGIADYSVVHASF
jgi:hypothetical protein